MSITEKLINCHFLWTFNRRCDTFDRAINQGEGQVRHKNERTSDCHALHVFR